MSGTFGSPQLDLAAKWAEALELKVESLTALDPEGHAIPGLALVGPNLRYAMIEVREVLLLVCDLSIPENVRTATSKLKPKLQEEMLIALRQALLECPRLGWNFIPPTTAKIGDLVQIRLSERFRLEVSQVDSFNRFADAVQEMSTAAVKAGAVFGQLMTGSFLTSGALPKGDEPRTGYG